jgi:hypothetical protein
VADKDQKLGLFLREVSNWKWDEFWRAERDHAYSSNEAAIFALIRSCAMQKMDAIKLSLNRLDGKLKTPIKVEFPKVYYLYPNATLPAIESAGPHAALPEPEVMSGEIVEAEPEEPEPDLTTLSLRQTLAKMSDYPRALPHAIVERAELTEQWLRNQGPEPADIPLVKSVVAAHMLIMAQKRDITALSEVFDQVDGKLTETIQLLGDDIYITSYVTEAPPGAYVNEDGILQLEATVAQDLWTNKLGREATKQR